MGDLAEKTTITAEGLVNLVEQFKGKGNLDAFATAFLDQLQDLEGASFELIDERTIETAIGVQLDGLGQIIGRARGGLNDDDYRIRLRAQILINRSSGTVPELIAILVLLETSAIQINQFSPASINVTIVDIDSDPELIAGIIRDARAGAVGSQLIYSLVAGDDTFSFSSGDTEEASSTQGWANDAQTTGGQFADVEGA